MGCALSDQTLRMGEYYEVLRGLKSALDPKGIMPRDPGAVRVSLLRYYVTISQYHANLIASKRLIDI
jgi:hypothetical protein